uniref:Fatty acid desaturase domain-containing protein n=1 Tax=Peronospora matthiolae TaxID=2874970 RepID=A0AAV1VEX8_9STRA
MLESTKAQAHLFDALKAKGVKPLCKATAANELPTESEEEEEGEIEKTKDVGFKWSDVVWYNVLVLLSWHVGALYALLFVLPRCSLKELLVLWLVLWLVSGLGITAGAHRLWSHRSFKAKRPLRVFLMLSNSMAFQGSIFEWARDHRVHHKGSDSTADPHDSQRGLFFSHMGWIMLRKHEDVRAAGKTLDFTDLLADPVVTFQTRHYGKLAFLMCYFVPTAMGSCLFSSASSGFWVGGIFRHVWVLHMTWMVNSVAHFFGYKPYDLKIRAVENLFVALGALGEGYHNYHHKYPSDYATSEWGILSGQYNPTKAFIDFCALIGQAYDLKRSRTAAKTRDVVAKQVNEELMKSGTSQTISWWDSQISQLCFGKSETQIF